MVEFIMFVMTNKYFRMEFKNPSIEFAYIGENDVEVLYEDNESDYDFNLVFIHFLFDRSLKKKLYV